ncbi:efflux transporter outer membrane subunit [Bradyrhizobium genosp. A]|uniref:efflux transporter outer membrane subunit n=1 Tax=Bradyrhizobium genosp. A TaxID=83626 RepID=UPI003CF24EF6
MNPARGLGATAALGAVVLLGGCAVGPDYHRPDTVIPAAFKEAPRAPAGWKVAAPKDDADRGKWWSVYHDPLLDRLEAAVDIGNQNLKAYEAAYRRARAVVDEARSGLFPALFLVPSGSRSRASNVTKTTYSLEASANWDLDVWGKVRRQVESDSAAAQASAADLASIRLSAHAELAKDYFELRYQDSLRRLLSDTVSAYQRSLEIATNQYNAGTAARSDVVTAETQLQTAQAQLVAVGVSRAQFEHAIALLTGQPPAGFAIPAAALRPTVPLVPAALPSTLLERRPDVAQAERTMQQQNALIGVAVAAYYPDVSLSAAFGYAGTPLRSLITTTNQVWTLAANGSQLLVDGGGRSAAIRAARATYDQSVANYRQTVLSAFRDVEDALSTLRTLAQQAKALAAAVASSRKAVEIALHEYQAGGQAFTAVVTAQATALLNEESALQVQEARFVATVALMKALGGGWNVGDIEGAVTPVAAGGCQDVGLDPGTPQPMSPRCDHGGGR